MAEWLEFFKKCGIEHSAALDYSTYFVKNKIKFDMLNELNSHYLTQMNITNIGDQIQILRYTKKMSDQNIKSRILAENERSEALVKTVSTMKTLSHAELGAKGKLAEARVKPTKVLTKRPAPSDSIEKGSIFKRLTLAADVKVSSKETPVKEVKSKSSIFNRLGNYKELSHKEEEEKLGGTGSSGILKRSVEKVKPPLMKKLSLNSSSGDDSVDKQVKFSDKVCLRLYSDPKVTPKVFNHKIESSVKSRLGNRETGSLSESVYKLKKSPMKPEKFKFDRTKKMHSDMELTRTVHSRLDKSKFSTSIFKRLGD